MKSTHVSSTGPGEMDADFTEKRQQKELVRSYRARTPWGRPSSSLLTAPPRAPAASLLAQRVGHHRKEVGWPVRLPSFAHNLQPGPGEDILIPQNAGIPQRLTLPLYVSNDLEC